MTPDVAAQVYGLLLIVLVVGFGVWRRRRLERRVWREASAPLPGRTRDLPGCGGDR